MQGFATVLDYLFGCRHRHLSRVFTIDGRSYRVCCRCGAQFDYSLEHMCLRRRREYPPIFAWSRIA